MAREKLCVGIDIGASSVKLCQLKQTKTGYTLQHFGVAPLPPEAVVDGALMNSPRIVEAVQELIAAHKIRNKRAAISLSGHSVIIKKIPLPQMSKEDLEESIKWEAEQFIPFDIQDVNIDVQIVSEESQQSGQMDVVLVAAKKDLVNEYTSVIAEAGLEPEVCDVDAFALQNMFEVNYDLVPDQTFALVNVGASKTNINILSEGIPNFTRDLTVGGNAFTEEIQKQMNLSFEEAETLKVGGAESENEDVVIPTEVQRALQNVAENLTGDVQRSLDFASQNIDVPPSEIYLTGGSARLQLLARSLESKTRLPVNIVDPFRQIQLSPQHEEFLRGFGPAAAVVVGLALRYMGDS